MDSRVNYYCSKCHMIGEIDRFEFKTLSQGCITLICNSCKGKSAVVKCTGCERDIFLKIEVIDQSKIFSCVCQMSYRILSCRFCQQYIQIKNKGQLQQGATISCQNCHNNQVILNCPNCQAGQSFILRPSSKFDCFCNQCSCQFQFDECPDQYCMGEVFTIKQEKSKCTLQIQHQFEVYQCQNKECQNLCYVDKKENDYLLFCKGCQASHIKTNCMNCYKVAFVLRSEDNKKGIKTSQCNHCKSEQLQIQCPGCLIGIMQIGLNWFDYVQNNVEQTTSPLCQIKCNNCQQSRTLVLCKKCKNIRLFEPKELIGNCQYCEIPQEKEKKRVNDVKNPCCVCLERECAYIIKDCGHACLCKLCLDQLICSSRKCPICKGIITEYMKIYF